MPPTNATSRVGIVAPHDHDDLLVVAATAPDAMVEQHLAAGLVDDPREGQVLPLAEVHRLRVRAPEQPAYVDAPTGQLRRSPRRPRCRDRELSSGSPCQSVKYTQSPDSAVAQHLVQAGEVLRPVDQDRAVVALGPAVSSPVTTVDLGGGIAPFDAGRNQSSRCTRQKRQRDPASAARPIVRLFDLRSSRGDGTPARTASSCAASAAPKRIATDDSSAHSRIAIIPANGP